ncbi:MAG: PGF-pre-PGF domain-containing protein, partial [Candidatus Aenigmarchaeota archaeon]
YTFDVNVSWLTENALDPSSVTVYGYYNGKWGPITAILVSSGATSNTYTATIPGFSYFAITALKLDAALCTPDTKRCVGNYLQQCRDGSTWDVLEVCEHGCDPAVLACLAEVVTPEAVPPWYEEEGPLAALPDVLPWVIAGVAIIIIAGAGAFLIRRRPRKKVALVAVREKVPPLKKDVIVPSPPKPVPKPEEFPKPVHATIKEIQLKPQDFIGKAVRISGRMYFSHKQQLMDGRKWHMFKDETGRIPSADHKIFTGRGEIIAVVVETKTHQVFLRIIDFRKQ